EHLHLRRVLVDPLRVFAGAEEDAAVAAGRDHPLEGELEVLELVHGDDVATRADPGERAIHDLPALGHALLPVAAPTGRGLAVEEQAPACRLLLGREGVRRRLTRFLLRGRGCSGSDKAEREAAGHRSERHRTSHRASCRVGSALRVGPPRGPLDSLVQLSSSTVSMIRPTSPYSTAAAASSQKLRRVSSSMRSSGWPVCRAIMRFTRSRIRRISRASMSMSAALPPTPPAGWCSRKRVLGRQKRSSRGTAT